MKEKIKSIGKIILVMYAVTAVLLFLFAALVQKFGWESHAISIGISVVYVLSCFLGGFLSGKVQKTKKYIWGILMGLMYVIVMLAVTMLAKNGLHSAMPAVLLNMLLCLGAGMLGGMLS